MILRKVIPILFVLAWATSCAPDGMSTVYNLDFEYADAKRLPQRWHVSDPGYFGYDSSLDSQKKQSGRQSLMLTQRDSTRVGWAFFAQQLPAELVAGREVELSGWIRTQGVDGGFADFFLLDADEQDDALALDTPGRGIRTTTGWTRLSLRKKCGASSSGLDFGGVLRGRGTAWFDGLELTIDGEKLVDTLLPAPKTRLTREDKAELRKYVYPLRTYDPGAAETDDLKVLDSLVGRAGVVALGENSHGSGEIYRMKDRMIRYLAANAGFDIFSIEANMPESYRVNEYTVEGRGNPKRLLDGMYFWTWRTQEMLDLVEWMRRFNGAEPRIRYTGFDMQAYEGSVAELRKAFEEDSPEGALVAKIASGLEHMVTYTPIGPRVDVDAAQVLAADLERLDVCIAAVCDDGLQAWLRQQIVLLRQYIGQGTSEWRDRCMAENLQWIRRQNPSSRIVVWAHNGHIQRTDRKMGAYLKDSLSDDYVTFGFTFYDGSYTAVRGDSNGWEHPAERACPGTVEYVLGQLDEPIFILDMKKMREDHSPIVAWMERLKYRHVGAVKTRNDFFDAEVTSDFDYLVFIRESSPSHLYFLDDKTN